MDAQQIINYIATSEKKTPVKVYVRERAGACVDYGSARVFGAADKIVFGNWAELEGLLAEQADAIEDLVVECDRRNSGVPLLDIRTVDHLGHDLELHVHGCGVLGERPALA